MNLKFLITQECNFNCIYCCNLLPNVQGRFTYKFLNEIEFEKYDEISITGGEPLLLTKGGRFFFELGRIMALKKPSAKIFLYTNGIFLNEVPWGILEIFDGINIGIHKEGQVNEILKKNPGLPDLAGIRFYVEDVMLEKYIPLTINRSIVFT
jgi:sulfatase maturation enzyme AslB (radical SAM superfamily)